MARPSQLTPEIQERVCQLIRVGNTVEVSAGACGVTSTTFYNWMKRDEFRKAVENARADAEAILVGRVQKAAQSGSWRAACWLLERQWPERWAALADRSRAGDQLDRELAQLLASEE